MVFWHTACLHLIFTLSQFLYFSLHCECCSLARLLTRNRVSHWLGRLKTLYTDNFCCRYISCLVWKKKKVFPVSVAAFLSNAMIIALWKHINLKNAKSVQHRVKSFSQLRVKFSLLYGVMLSTDFSMSSPCSRKRPLHENISRLYAVVSENENNSWNNTCKLFYENSKIEVPFLVIFFYVCGIVYQGMQTLSSCDITPVGLPSRRVIWFTSAAEKQKDQKREDKRD